MEGSKNVYRCEELRVVFEMGNGVVKKHVQHNSSNSDSVDGIFFKLWEFVLCLRHENPERCCLFQNHGNMRLSQLNVLKAHRLGLGQVRLEKLCLFRHRCLHLADEGLQLGDGGRDCVVE